MSSVGLPPVADIRTSPPPPTSRRGPSGDGRPRRTDDEIKTLEARLKDIEDARADDDWGVAPVTKADLEVRRIESRADAKGRSHEA